MKIKEIKVGMTIHCQTYEQVETLMRHLISNGYTWNSHEKLKADYCWTIYKERTCYHVAHGQRLQYSPVEYYKGIRHEITEFDDLFIEEEQPVPKSVDEIMSFFGL